LHWDESETITYNLSFKIQFAMSDEKKDTSDKEDEKNQKKKSQMDKELRQTFPASDPPSRSRPGHADKDDDES